MHPLIADLVNPYYGNRLHAASKFSDEVGILADHPLTELILRGRTVFMETGPAPMPKLHKDEAALAARLALAIRQAWPELSIGILSPWRAQNRQIILELEAVDLPVGDEEGAIKVDTIERFQGAERDVIILSTALAEARLRAAMQSIMPRPGLPSGYQSVDRKLVVALSRARQRVIVLGHAPFLSSDEHYGSLLEIFRKRRCFVSRQEVEAALSLVQQVGP